MEIHAEIAIKEHKKYRITFNTKDVTKLCVAANDSEGWVDMTILAPDSTFIPEDVELEQDNTALEFEAAMMSIPFKPMQTKPKVQRYTGKVIIEDVTNL